MKITQKDLLNEGFWDSFPGRALKGAAAVGKFAAKVAAPEIYNPISKAVTGIKDLNQQVIKATTSTSKYIINKLSNQGYSVIGDVTKIAMKPGDRDQLYKVSVNIRPDFIRANSPNPTKIFIVNKEGGIVRDLSANNATTRRRPRTNPARVIRPAQPAPTP